MRHQKSAQELKKEAFKIYNIWALWKQNRDLHMSSIANRHVGPKQSSKLVLNDSISSIYLLSEIPQRSLPLFSK